MDSTDCRFHLPGAKLHYTPRYGDDLDFFYDADEEAAHLYEALLRRAQSSGLSTIENANQDDLPAAATTHRAAVGKKAHKRLRPWVTPMPWLGELTVEGSEFVDGQGPFWRGYFTDLRECSDPTLEVDDVLMASIRVKGGKGGVKRGEQDQHMAEAGDAVREWCESRTEFTFRIQK